MKLSIIRNTENYELNFDVITQLCGQNITIKNYIVDSICKHFSSDKYKDYEEEFIENISIDGEVPGRKQWECYRIRSKEDMISAIQMNKSSILGKCIKESVSGFECQNDLMEIDNILLRVFARLNQTLFTQLPIELQYSQEDLFSIIQQTSVRTNEGADLHALAVEDVLNAFIEIIKMQQSIIPEKRLFVFENIDHYMNNDCYIGFVKKCEEMARASNIWFIFTTSLDGYVYISVDSIESINIINDEIYSLPSEEHLNDFINNYYPINKPWNFDDIKRILNVTIQDIGKQSSLRQADELVFLKLINETLDIGSEWEKRPSAPEIQCLLAADVV